MARIKLTNSVELESITMGIDSGSVLASKDLNLNSESTYSYTTSQNAYAVLCRYGFNGAVTIKIDDTELSSIQMGDGNQTTYYDNVVFPLRSGQKITLTKVGTGERRAHIQINIYGAK